MTTEELKAENAQLKRDNEFAVRIMEAIRKYSEGDKDALGGMGVPWVDDMRAGLASEKERADGNFAALERVKEKHSAAVNELASLREALKNCANLLDMHPDYVLDSERKLAVAEARELLAAKE